MVEQELGIKWNVSARSNEVRGPVLSIDTILVNAAAVFVGQHHRSFSLTHSWYRLVPRRDQTKEPICGVVQLGVGSSGAVGRSVEELLAGVAEVRLTGIIEACRSR